MNLIPIYSVPFWNSEYQDFEENKQIFLNAIKNYREKNNSTKELNSPNYRCQGTLHHVDELRPLFEHICQLAFKAIGDLDFIECDIAITSAWLEINDAKYCEFNKNIHGNVFSGIFYLQSPNESGKFILKNPAINCMWAGCSLTSQKNEFTGENIKIDPVDGNIFLFPSYLPYSVETNNQDEERISIHFNIIAFPKGSIQ